MFSKRSLTGTMPLVAAMAVTACSSDSTGPDQSGGRTVSLSVATTGSSSVAAGTSLGVITIGTGGELVISRAQIVLREVELEAASSAGCDLSSAGASFSRANFSNGSDDSGDDLSTEDCAEIELGPMLIDLPLDAGTTQTIAVTVPEGSYHELEFEVDTPDDDTGADLAFRAANPAFANISVRVEGTYNGQPFTWTSDVEAEVENEFQPPLVIAAGANNVTLQVDVARWFRDGSGNAIDPSAAQGNTSAREQVEANIINSFEAFEDDDRDGDDDNSGDDS